MRHALALREKDQAVRDAREALSAREREYRMLFENANDAIVIFDPETEEILAANPAAGRLYDCPHMELVGTSLIGQLVSVGLALGVSVALYAKAVLLMRIPEARQIEDLVRGRLRRA